MWLSVENDSVLDNSNPLGDPGGEDYCQRCDENGEVSSAIGFTGVSEETCLIGPDGCQLGWLGSDIEITANAAWLDENPAAEALFSAFNPSLLELSIASEALNSSPGSQGDVEAIAAKWIEENQELVDEWLAAARAVA